MLHAQLIGSGSLGYTEGQDYTCSNNVCNAADLALKASSDFFDLQTQLNRVAGRAGFVPLTVDGQIGASTVGAVQKAIKALKINIDASQFTTASSVAAQADWLSAAVKVAADQAGIPSTPSTNAGLRLKASLKSNLGWWIVGGLGVVAAGVGTYAWARHRKQSSSFSPRRTGRSRGRRS